MSNQTSNLNLIWANKPNCSRCVAEIWIEREHLWFTLFVDDNDSQIKIEVLPPRDKATTYLVDLAEAERLVYEAKRDLMAMPTPHS